MTDWSYDAWAPADPANWWSLRHSHPHEQDPHLDIGCGRIKKGRIGVDLYPGPGVDVVLDLNREPLPFPDSSIRSIISHHCFEHIGDGFVALVDECYRVLEPDGIMRAITPLFPSRAAVDDPSHCRYFTESSWQAFCGEPREGGHWMEGFATPYMRSRWRMLDQDVTALTPPELRWTVDDVREIRVSLQAVK